MSIEQEGSDVRVVLPPGAAREEARPVDSDLVMPIHAILDLCSAASLAAVIHAATGGTHSAAIGVDDRIAFHAEDISRSAALERAVGMAHIAGHPLSGSVLVLSSRVPDGFVSKAALSGMPIIAAVSAPTAQAVDRAERLGICLCGFVRGSRANVYSCPWRVGL